MSWMDFKTAQALKAQKLSSASLRTQNGVQKGTGDAVHVGVESMSVQKAISTLLSLTILPPTIVLLTRPRGSQGIQARARSQQGSPHDVRPRAWPEAGNLEGQRKLRRPSPSVCHP